MKKLPNNMIYECTKHLKLVPFICWKYLLHYKFKFATDMATSGTDAGRVGDVVRKIYYERGRKYSTKNFGKKFLNQVMIFYAKIGDIDKFKELIPSTNLLSESASCLYYAILNARDDIVDEIIKHVDIRYVFCPQLGNILNKAIKSDNEKLLLRYVNFVNECVKRAPSIPRAFHISPYSFSLISLNNANNCFRVIESMYSSDVSQLLGFYDSLISVPIRHYHLYIKSDEFMSHFCPKYMNFIVELIEKNDELMSKYSKECVVKWMDSYLVNQTPKILTNPDFVKLLTKFYQACEHNDGYKKLLKKISDSYKYGIVGNPRVLNFGRLFGNLK